MASLSPYKGLEVVEGASGDGGIALTDNFKELADRAPYAAAADPGANDDSSAGFAAGDQWLNTSTQTMWSCVDASVGAAVWKSLYQRSSTALSLIPEESADEVQVAGSLVVDGALTAASADLSGDIAAAGANLSGDLAAANAGLSGNLTLPNAGVNGPTTTGLGLWIKAANGTPVLVLYKASGNALRLDSGGANTYIDLRGSNLLVIEATTNSPRLVVLSSGNVGVGTASPTAKLDVNGDTIRLRTSKTPSSSSDTGNAGDVCWDSNYLYVCVAANTWKRAALSTW